MKVARKPAKALIVTIIVITILILLTALTFGGIYLYSEAVIFDHRDCNTAYSFSEYVDGYSIKYPRFGNPMMIGVDVDENGITGRIYSLTFGKGGLKNVPVYDAINSPLCIWVDYLMIKYKNRVNLDYTLEQDSSTITVCLTGNAEDDEEQSVSLEQKFVFDIKDAGPDNLPDWVNQNEASAEFKEYWNYLNNTSSMAMPDWLAEQLQAQ